MTEVNRTFTGDSPGLEKWQGVRKFSPELTLLFRDQDEFA